MKSFMNLRQQLILHAVTFAMCGALASTVNAELLWYDGFSSSDYTFDADLAGQVGGAGTFFSTDPWEQPPGSTDNHHVVGPSLTAPGQLVPSSPDGAVSDDNAGGGCCQTSRSSRLFTTPWSGRTPPEGTFYMGFLANFGDRGSALHHRVLEMHNGGYDDTANRNLMMGYSEFAGVGTDGNLGLVVKNVADDSTTSLTLPNSQMDGRTHSYVLKFELSNTADSDSVSLFVDPPSFDEPGAATLEVLSTNIAYDRMSPIVNFIFADDTTPSQFDELRVATTFTEAVIPIVPEPTSFALLGLGTLMLIGRRR